MAIDYLTPPQEIGITEANQVFDALDEALGILFNWQSPLLYLPYSGASSYAEAGLAGVRFVFGTKASRKIFADVDSHDQDAIDAAVAAASTVGSPDHTLKQVTLDLTAGYLGNSLVVHTRDTTPPTGPDEPYFARVEFLTGHYHHEHYHELAVADVIFEGHASRTFTWLEEWNKFRCIRFHNLDSDSTPLVITMEETSETFTLSRWECLTVRRSADGTSWVEVGFLLWRMRSDDLTRFGGTMPWNDRRRATSGATYDSVWVSDGANNVASWALVWWLIDYFSAPSTPAEVHTQCGDGVDDAFDPKTGFHFNLSSITRNAGTLAPFPDPTDDATLVYQLAWHGGRMTVVTKNDDLSETTASGSPTIAQLLAGDASTGLTLDVATGGMSAHLKLTSETGKDYADVIPYGTNIGASGNPFTVPADTIGYNVPPAMDGTWSGIVRWADDTEYSETIAGIGTTVTTDYTRLKEDNASDGSSEFPPFEATIADVKAWSFTGGGKNNDHSSFTAPALRWDGRRLAVNATADIVPVDGRAPTDTAASKIAGVSGVTQRTVVATSTTLSIHQASVIQDWPTVGGIWLTPSYARRANAQVADGVAHPHVSNYTGTSTGADWTAQDTTSFRRSAAAVARQNPIESGSGSHNVVSPELSCCYFEAKDSSEYIAANIGTAGWWASNRTTAIAGTTIGSESRPAIAVPIMARHFNVLAARFNALLEVFPFSYFDSQYYGRLFRPDYSDGGIFGGYVYPEGFICYSTGDVATRASDLGMTVSDFQTDYSVLSGYSNMTITGVYQVPAPSTAFDSGGTTGFDAWNKDLPLWFNPDAAVDHAEATQIDSSSPGTGWVQGELAYTVDGIDFYWWQYDNNTTDFAFPDFDFITAANAKAVADGLGIPFRLFRLAQPWQVYEYTPDRVGLGSRFCHVEGGSTATRTEVRLVPFGTIGPIFHSFAGTNDLWSPLGVVRLSDWAPFPDTQGSDDSIVQESNADPMHGFNRTGAGDALLYPFQFYDGTGPTWSNDCPFSGESPRLELELYDETPTAPSGWTNATTRLACYPVPATQWGASDIESNPAPSCSVGFFDASSFGAYVYPSEVWDASDGAGAWDGKGAFAVHIIPAGVRKS